VPEIFSKNLPPKITKNLHFEAQWMQAFCVSKPTPQSSKNYKKPNVKAHKTETVGYSNNQLFYGFFHFLIPCQFSARNILKKLGTKITQNLH
jgi:hypothetical protein